MKNSRQSFRKVLRVVSVIGLLLYILFLIGERVPLFGAGFADASVYLLFLVFLVGFAVFWKNELVSGLILIAWYGLQWVLVLWVWPDGGMTVILGFPIAVFGVIALVYGISERRNSGGLQ